MNFGPCKVIQPILGFISDALNIQSEMRGDSVSGALFVEVQSWQTPRNWVYRDKMQSAITNQTKIGRRCESDSGRVEGRPGDRIVSKTWRMKGSWLLLRVHGKGEETREQQPVFPLYCHMRVSVPGIPQAILDAKHHLSIKSISEATERLVEFIGGGNVTLLTGAGVSVDSGIRAYRGEDGRYMNPNYK